MRKVFKGLKKRAESSDKKLNTRSARSGDTVLGDLIDFYVGAEGRLKKQSLALIRHLLFIRQVNVNIPNSSGLTPIGMVAINGLIGICSLIITTGQSNLDSKDIDGNTALHHCARYGYVKLAILLIFHGASLTAKNYSNEDCLDVAIRFQQATFCRYLATVADPQTKHIALIQESISGASWDFETVRDLWRIKVLVTAGADVHRRGVGGKTLMHLACIHLASVKELGSKYKEGAILKINLLTSLGARLDIADDKGKLPTTYLSQARALTILAGQNSHPGPLEASAAVQLEM